MKNNFYAKLGVIFGLILLLRIPRAYIGGVVYERQGWRQKAYDSIGQGWPGVQTLAGPVLMLPYVLTYHTKEKIIDVNQTEKEIVKEATQSDALYLIPEQLRVASQLKSSERYRGIYQVPVYASQVEVPGKFNTQPVLDLLARNKGNAIRFEKPQLSVRVRDQRGVVTPSSLTWDRSSLLFKPGANLHKAAAGMHAVLPDLKLEQQAQKLPFAFKLELRGMRAMNFALLAEDSEVRLKAIWPHPSFTGELLPEEREIGKEGFSAVWRASTFSYNVIGAFACTALLTLYFWAILRSRRFGLLLGSGLSLLYAVLYVILQAEDYAMLMGIADFRRIGRPDAGDAASRLVSVDRAGRCGLNSAIGIRKGDWACVK